MEVQPSSIAKYSLAGLPYFSKTFEHSTQSGEELNDSENYLTKLSRARKNYMPNWAYSPYFYNKISNWYNYNNLTYFFSTKTTVGSVKFILNSSKSYKDRLSLADTKRSVSTPSYSGLNRSNTTT